VSRPYDVPCPQIPRDVAFGVNWNFKEGPFANQHDDGAFLMSGAMQSGEPAKTLTLGADAISQPNGGAAVILAAGKTVAAGKPPQVGNRRGCRGYRTLSEARRHDL
jgi:hypothetical protein